MEALIGKHADKIPIITPQDGVHRVPFMDRLPTARSLCCRLTGWIFELGRF